MSRLLIILFIFLALGCDKEQGFICITPDMIGEWNAAIDTRTVDIVTGLVDSDTTYLKVEFFRMNSGRFGETDMDEFNWYLQCKPDELLISRVIGNDFYSTSSYSILSFGTDNVTLYDENIDSVKDIRQLWKLIRIN